MNAGGARDDHELAQPLAGRGGSLVKVGGFSATSSTRGRRKLAAALKRAIKAKRLPRPPNLQHCAQQRLWSLCAGVWPSSSDAVVEHLSPADCAAVADPEKFADA
jgi:hypothetical protein